METFVRGCPLFDIHMEKKFFLRLQKINCSHEPLFARSLDIRFAGC
jgi:hypothetical protein